MNKQNVRKAESDRKKNVKLLEKRKKENKQKFFTEKVKNQRDFLDPALKAVKSTPKKTIFGYLCPTFAVLICLAG